MERSHQRQILNFLLYVGITPLILSSFQVHPAPATTGDDFFEDTPSWSSGASFETYGVALGDVDIDGDLDLVCGNYLGPATLYRNRNGQISTTPDWTAGSMSSWSMYTALGDINGDGYLDLICGLGLYLNENGTFSQDPVWTGNGFWQAVLGDVDGDGDLDLVGTDRGNPDGTRLYLNDGGVFQGGHAWSGSASSVALGDVDKDGNLDLVCGLRGPSLYLGNGEVFSSEPDWGSEESTYTESIALGDVNGDGFLDIVCGNDGSPNTMYLNHNGVFSATPSWSDEESNHTWSISLGDIDQDGDLDLVCGNNGYNESNTLYLNDMGDLSTTPEWSSEVANYTWGIALGDVDGDGDLDLVCGNAGQANTLYANLGRFLSTSPSWSTESSTAVSLGDIDDDGDLDLVCGSDTNTLYLNEHGVLQSTPIWSSDAGGVGVALVDMDGDRDLDLLCSDRFIHYNDGGFFPPNSNVVVRKNVQRRPATAVGDVDRDGDLDFVAGGDLYLNEGGVLSSEPAWSGEGGGYSVALGDVDGDLAPDVVLGHSLYLNTGGTFADSSAWSSQEDVWTYDAALEDVDGDGDLDLILGNAGDFLPTSSNMDLMYTNEGGVLSQDPSWWGPDYWTDSVEMGDIDADGDLDLICDGSGYTNDNGTLSATSWSWSFEIGQYIGDAALGDIDGDGDLDVISARRPSNELHLGLVTPPYRHDPQSPTDQLPNNGAFLRFVNVEDESRNHLRVTFTAIDVESDSIFLTAAYQFRGDPTSFPLDVEGSTGRLGPFGASPEGTEGEFDWSLERFPFDPRRVVLRLRVIEIPGRVSLIQHAPPYLKELGPIVPRRPTIETDSDRLVFPSVTLGDSISLRVTIHNRGNESLVVSRLDLPSTEMLIDITAPFEVPVGGREEVTLTLAPRERLDATGSVVVRCNDPVTPMLDIPIEAHILDLSYDTVLMNPSEVLPLGDAVTVVVRPDPNVIIEIGSLWHRSSGTNAHFSQIPLEYLLGDFVATIPGVAITEHGLDYYVEVENSDIVRTDPADAPDAYYSVIVEQPQSVLTYARPSMGTVYGESLDIEVQVDLEEGTEFTDGFLYYRQGGLSSYDSTSIALEGPDLLATIPGSDVGARGVEYWARVQTATRILTDPADSPRDDPIPLQITVQGLVEPTSHTGGQYRMISIPLDFQASPDVTIEHLLAGQSDFGPYEPSRWRTFAWDRPSGGYLELSDEGVNEAFALSPGKGFWLICRENHRIDSSRIAGLSTPTDEPYDIALFDGWNLVGNPFVFAIAWADVLVDTLQTGEQDLVEPPVRWLPTDGNRGGYADSVAMLDSFESYWVRCYRDAILRIPPLEANNQPLVGASRLGGFGFTHQDWRIQIIASSSFGRDAVNYAGVHPGASSEWDRWDRSDPPLNPGPAISLYFPHEAWEQNAGVFCSDIREAHGAGASRLSGEASGWRWDFDIVISGAGGTDPQEIILEFLGIGTVPERSQVFLLDRHLGHTLDLCTEEGYIFVQQGHRSYVEEVHARFALLVGDEDFILAELEGAPEDPRITRLHQNYPNPFRSASVIRYDLAQPGQVRIEVFDVQGRLLRVLENRYREPGRYELIWRTVNRPRSAPAGIYFYRMTTPGFSMTHKMLCTH